MRRPKELLNRRVFVYCVWTVSMEGTPLMSSHCHCSRIRSQFNECGNGRKQKVRWRRRANRKKNGEKMMGFGVGVLVPTIINDVFVSMETTRNRCACTMHIHTQKRKKERDEDEKWTFCNAFDTSSHVSCAFGQVPTTSNKCCQCRWNVGVWSLRRRHWNMRRP